MHIPDLNGLLFANVIEKVMGPKDKKGIVNAPEKKIGFKATDQSKADKPTAKEKESSTGDIRKEKITNRDEKVTNKTDVVTNKDDDNGQKVKTQSDDIFEPGKLPSKERKEIRKKIHKSQPNDTDI